MLRSDGWSDGSRNGAHSPCVGELTPIEERQNRRDQQQHRLVERTRDRQQAESRNRAHWPREPRIPCGQLERAEQSLHDCRVARSLTWVSRKWFPDGSRNDESIPYGRSSGVSTNSTPRAFSAS